MRPSTAGARGVARAATFSRRPVVRRPFRASGGDQLRSGPDGLDRPWGVRALILAGLGLAAVCAVRAPGHWGGAPADAFFAKWLYDAAAAIGGVLCAWRAIRVAGDRITWSLIATAFVLEVAGNTLYAARYGAATGPVPSVADVFWVAFYLPMATALVLRIRAAASVAGAVIFDIVIATGALGSVSAAFVLQAVIGGTSRSIAEYATMLAYPVGDLVLAALVLQLAAATGWRLGRATALMAACFVAWGVTDTIYAFQTVHAAYVPGGVLDLGWIVPFVAFGVAAWMAPDARVSVRQTPSLGALGVPVGFALLALGMLIYSGMADVNVVAVGLASGALVAVIARFVVTFRSYLAALADTRLVLETAYDPFMSFEANGVITDWNAAAQASFGWSRDEVLGRNLIDTFLPEARREPHRRLIASFLDSGQEDVLRRRLERTVIHRDGHEMPIELTISPVETDYGTTFHAFLRDITEQREVERAKDEFVAIVSHELRTPLTSIRGSLGLLAGGVLAASPVRAERMLKIALENTDRLVRMVSDILNLERIESGAADLTYRQCDAGQLVRVATDAMRSAAVLAGVTLEVADRGGALEADPDQIIRTLTNLLSNAIKFSPEGSTVWAESEARPGEVLFRVTDLGRGIPSGQLERVFERFAQVDSSDARDKGGTGLGLAICRSIVEQHAGRIWVESGHPGGCRFQFTLPAVRPDQAETVPPAAAGSVDPGLVGHMGLA
jgi:PAS domain S-box-containing protein